MLHLGILTALLGASLLENLVTEKYVLRPGEGKKRTGQNY